MALRTPLGVAGQYLVEHEAHSTIGSSYPTLLGWPDTREWITQRPNVESNRTDLVKKKSMKQLLMIFNCTHRSVPYPLFIREASSGNRWEQTLRLTARVHGERV